MNNLSDEIDRIFVEELGSSTYSNFSYHENKTEGCLAKDIALHHICESDWKNNQQETKEFITQQLQNAKT